MRQEKERGQVGQDCESHLDTWSLVEMLRSDKLVKDTWSLVELLRCRRYGVSTLQQQSNNPSSKVFTAVHTLQCTGALGLKPKIYPDAGGLRPLRAVAEQGK